MKDLAELLTRLLTGGRCEVIETEDLRRERDRFRSVLNLYAPGMRIWDRFEHIDRAIDHELRRRIDKAVAEALAESEKRDNAPFRRGQPTEAINFALDPANAAGIDWLRDWSAGSVPAQIALEAWLKEKGQ